MFILKNILNNDEFNYSIIQINGKIKPFCKCNKIQVFNSTSKITIQFPITVYGYFKVFCELLLGENIIKLFCSHNEISLCLKYVLKKVVNIVEALLIVCTDIHESLRSLQKNGISLESCKNRLQLAIKLVQSFIGESLYSSQYLRRSFCYDGNVNIFKSKLTVEECLKMKEKELWYQFANEITQAHSDKVLHTKWIAFMSFTEYDSSVHSLPKSHEEVIALTKGYSALGSNGLALLGTGNIYSFPETLSQVTEAFTNCKEVDRKVFMDDSAFRGFFWSNFSTGLGTMLHELSHCFAMGHSKLGIMQRGGDDINVVLSFTVDSYCALCQTKLRKQKSIERKDIELLYIQGEFSFSQCKSLNHRGQCFYTENNLIMLNKHKWLTQCKESIYTTKTSFQIKENTIESTYGFLLIEIRTLYPENLCVGTCKFNQKLCNQSFTARKISQMFKDKSVLRTNNDFILVVMDVIGNIISVNFQIDMRTLSLKLYEDSVKYID